MPDSNVDGPWIEACIVGVRCHAAEDEWLLVVAVSGPVIIEVVLLMCIGVWLDVIVDQMLHPWFWVNAAIVVHRPYSFSFRWGKRLEIYGVGWTETQIRVGTPVHGVPY